MKVHVPKMIELKELGFAFKNQAPIFSQVNFNFEKACCYGLVGRNGAGKSTLFKLLLGVLRPLQGEILYDGVSVVAKRAHIVRDLGIVWGQRTSLWWDLSVKDNLILNGKLHGISQDKIEEFIGSRECSELIFNLYPSPLRKLSLGQRVLVDLLAVLSRKPKRLLLDEAFIGLDIHIKAYIFKLIREYRHEVPEATLIVASHYSSDLFELCDKLAFLQDKGIKTYQMDELNNQLKKVKLVSKTDDLIIKASDKILALKHEGSSTFEATIFNEGLDQFLGTLDFSKISYVEVCDADMLTLLESSGDLD